MFLKHTSRKLCAINLIFLCVLGGGEKTEEKKVQIPQAAHTYINKDRVSEDWFELEDRFERTKIERSQEWTLNFSKSRNCENIFVARHSLVGFVSLDLPLRAARENVRVCKLMVTKEERLGLPPSFLVPHACSRSTVTQKKNTRLSTFVKWTLVLDKTLFVF